MQNNPSNPICGPPSRLFFLLVAVLLVLGLTPAVLAQWVDFVDETSFRLVAAADRGASDIEEKDYAWGDLDKDGDIDLVTVRKTPVTSAGKRENVLFMNISGVLTDRTGDFATTSDVTGDQGFLTPTNDRDVAVADLNNDGWLDVITVTAISNNDPKHIGHPRIYMNQCCSVGGCGATSCSMADWNGLAYEDARIPQLLADDGSIGDNPCFCSVSAGDVTGDGYKDLWFVDYDNQCGDDFNDKLLINLGSTSPGFFVDVTETNFIDGAAGFPGSAFGASGDIRKMNEDGVNDLVKQFAGFVGIAFNDPADQGVFKENSSPYGGAAYFMSVGELNNDGKLDIVVSDDGQDVYLLNQGDGGDGIADFLSSQFDYEHQGVGGDSSDVGFAGNNIVADLDNDNWNDVLITDVDVDIAGCGRRMQIFRNQGGTPGSDVSLVEETTGTGCESFGGNPDSCLVASIPANKLIGTHDVAPFDINGDGFLDLVVGRCGSTEVYMNDPGLIGAGGVPNGDEIAGTMLEVDYTGLQLTLSWGASCSLDDDDYAIYQGLLGDWDSHSSLTCSTGGATTQSIAVPIGSAYFLVSPHNEAFEGSLGKTSAGTPRHVQSGTCKPISLGPCI